MIEKISVYCGGILTLLVTLGHTRFYTLFNWKDTFEKMGVPNNKIFYTIHIALMLTLFISGLLSIIYAKELSKCIGISLGYCIMLSLFWLWRMIWQITYFRGDSAHIAMIIAFCIIFISYTIPISIKFFKI